jgi:hypothetical protein
VWIAVITINKEKISSIFTWFSMHPPMNHLTLIHNRRINLDTKILVTIVEGHLEFIFFESSSFLVDKYWNISLLL